MDKDQVAFEPTSPVGHILGMQVDSTIKFVLLGVKSHKASSFLW